jgi:hypothetical protein
VTGCGIKLNRLTDDTEYGKIDIENENGHPVSNSDSSSVDDCNDTGARDIYEDSEDFQASLSEVNINRDDPTTDSDSSSTDCFETDGDNLSDDSEEESDSASADNLDVVDRGEIFEGPEDCGDFAYDSDDIAMINVDSVATDEYSQRADTIEPFLSSPTAFDTAILPSLHECRDDRDRQAHYDHL